MIPWLFEISISTSSPLYFVTPTVVAQSGRTQQKLGVSPVRMALTKMVLTSAIGCYSIDIGSTGHPVMDYDSLPAGITLTVQSSLRESEDTPKDQTSLPPRSLHRGVIVPRVGRNKSWKTLKVFNSGDGSHRPQSPYNVQIWSSYTR